jgi:hypothetical protein
MRQRFQKDFPENFPFGRRTEFPGGVPARPENANATEAAVGPARVRKHIQTAQGSAGSDRQLWLLEQEFLASRSKLAIAIPGF